MSAKPDRRPTSLHDALTRYERLRPYLQHLEPRLLPADLLSEAELLSGWLDIEGELRRFRTILCNAVERLADEELDDALLAPLWLLCDYLAPLVDAALAAEELSFHLKQHELAEQAAKAAPAKRHAKRQEVAA